MVCLLNGKYEVGKDVKPLLPHATKKIIIAVFHELDK